MYLPTAMIPSLLDDMYADDFICLAAVARHARRMKQEDIKQSILEAASIILSE